MIYITPKPSKPWLQDGTFNLNGYTLNIEGDESYGIEATSSVWIYGAGALNVIGAEYGVYASNSAAQVTVTNATAPRKNKV